MDKLLEINLKINDVYEFMKTLANPERLKILCKLSEGEISVGEIESSLDIKQPTLSQQLTVLRNEELVTTRRDGKNIYYSLTDEKTLAVLNVLHQQFCKGK